MYIAECQIAIHRHINQSDLDNSHDDEELRNESRQWRHTCKGHHEDEHGCSEEGFSLGEAAQGSKGVSAFFTLQDRENQEGSEFETNEYDQMEDQAVTTAKAASLLAFRCSGPQLRAPMAVMAANM